MWGVTDDRTTREPPVKPSAQSRLVLEAVAMEAKQQEVHWEKMMLAVERLTGKMEKLE